MRFVFALSWLATLLAPPVQDGEAEISGVVRFTGTHKPRLLNKHVDGMKHGVAPRGDQDVFDQEVVLGANGELANGLVWVKNPPKGPHPAPKDSIVIDAEGFFFNPRVVAVQAGQTLRLKNSGLSNCNFHLAARVNKEVNVGLVKGNDWAVKLEHPEFAVRLKHDCCPWMIAWVNVLDHPYFAVTGADGKFRIPNLPPGTYKLALWHEKFGDREADVTVGAKESKAQDFTIDP